MGFMDAVGAIAGVMAPPIGQYIAQGQQNQANWDLTQSANQASQASADKQMAFQADQVKKQMEFQERMAGSAHQREVEDLKKAGLNPILAANGGAQSPSGSAASGASAKAEAAPYESPLKAGITSAMETAQMAMSLIKLNSEIGVNRAQEANLKASTAKSGMETDVMRKDLPRSEIMNDLNDLYKEKAKPLLLKMFQGLGATGASKSQQSPLMLNTMKQQRIRAGGIR